MGDVTKDKGGAEVPDPDYRRRRVIAAVLALVPILLLLSLKLGGGGSGPRHTAFVPTGFFAEIRILSGAGPDSLAVAEQRAQDAAITRTLAYTPYVRIAGAQHREIALTFDDGPGPYTPQILGVLERHHAPATFFEVGSLEQYFHASTTRIVHDGFPVGDHTFSHPSMAQLTLAEQTSQLLRETAAIGDYGAPFPRLFRPPYGVWSSTTLQLLRRYRMLMVLWTVDTSDYQLPGVGAIIRAAVRGARPGAIILLHDAGGDRSETVAALPSIIRDLRARGYRLVTVPRLLLDNPAPRRQDVAGITGGA